MTGRIPLHRWFAIAGAGVLVATAAIHAAGYGSVSAAVGAGGVNPELAPALRAVWLMVAFHLVILAIIVVVASGAARGKHIVLVCALMPAADAVLLFRFVGVFVGTIDMVAATVLLVLSGLIRDASNSGGTGARRRR